VVLCDSCPGSCERSVILLQNFTARTSIGVRDSIKNELGATESSVGALALVPYGTCGATFFSSNNQSRISANPYALSALSSCGFKPKQPIEAAFPPVEGRARHNWTSSSEGAAMVGHIDRQGLGDDVQSKWWNLSHPSRGLEGG
jgi:hypothetical protein